MGTYKVNGIVFSFNTESKLAAAMGSIFALLAWFFMGCLLLYAFVSLTGYFHFSWLNGIWTAILLWFAVYIFRGND